MFSLQNLLLWVSSRTRLLSPGYISTQSCKNGTTLNNPGAFTDMVISIIPPLTCDKHKGQAGRIATIGGSRDYTGAPYFAAMSALRLGCDLTHVFCTSDASPVIKSYSPELIVHPMLDTETAVDDICYWLKKMHSVVIGPGLGRDDSILQNVKEIIIKCRELDLPLVIDADGVFLLSQYPDVIKDYKKAILTPNVVEFKHLYRKVINDDPNPDEPLHETSKLARSLGNVTIVKKGENDIISDGERVLVCCNEGSPRRCGGQGDILSGTMGTFLHWACNEYKDDTKTHNQMFTVYGPTICAAYGACLLTRQCAKQAFQRMGRQTTTSDLMIELPKAYVHLFEHGVAEKPRGVKRPKYTSNL
ncbi:ATP-dependent (S)-NAD(P)H-hydrate dehydratase-like [Ptychodera flava]|uniref:ATP-dependent (S)-NAD(P)H-hydrate dehydratase-like n=1 Tax=Ptychodera flava TaxID=63121 RepID=UPI00396A22FB